jgi:hypothetical protein
MDIIQLPAVPIVTPLRAALNIMAESHRSAVVTQTPYGIWMVSSSEVRAGINRREERLDKLTNIKMVTFNPIEIFAARPGMVGPPPALSLLQPMGSRHFPMNMAPFDPYKLDQILLGTPDDYTVIGQVPGIAYVLTRHEWLADIYADPPPRCACGNPVHVHEYGESDHVSSGEQCRVCTYTITCD